MVKISKKYIPKETEKYICAKRPAVIKGFKALNKDAEIDYP